MPALSSVKTTDSLTQQFEAIDAYLQAVHEVLSEGHMPDIADLDDRIALLCSHIEEAPLEVQEVCLKKLGDLLKKLDQCQNEMTSFHTTKFLNVQK
jgi:hypothetical protein